MRRALALTLGGLVSLPMSLAAASPEPGATAGPTGTWFDGLEVGTCFDDVFLPDGEFDYSVAAPIVPCDGPHANEVVARLPLTDAEFSSEDLVARVDERCLDEYERFLGRPIGDTLMSPFSVAPSADDRAAGARVGLCSVYAGEQVSGTAASGTLKAPGETLAVYREVEQKPDIWLVDGRTGEAVRNATDNALVKLIATPSWTPDGGAVVYSVEGDAQEDGSDVYVVSLESGISTPLLDGPAAEDSVVFSPDGSAIAYITDVDGGEFEIYARDLATGETSRLTDFEDRDSSPQWSPDGQRIAFRRRIEGVSDIWVMNADGSDQQRLTDNGGNNYDPRWSPDGAHIAFTTDHTGTFDIAIMAGDGSDQALLTTHPADDEFPSWSSDGEVIAFHSTRHGGVSLWLMRRDGSEQSELTGLAPVGFPMFAPAAARQEPHETGQAG